jgi:hypothetical protein
MTQDIPGISFNAQSISDSEENRRHNDANPRPSADDDDSEKDYGSQRVNDALKQWYNRKIRFTFEFPENFKGVPAISANEKILLKAIGYENVARRFLR